MIIKKLFVLSLISASIIAHDCFGMRRLAQTVRRNNKRFFSSSLTTISRHEKKASNRNILWRLAGIVGGVELARDEKSTTRKKTSNKILDAKLITATREDQTETVAFLLQEGANPNARNEEGLTALHIAVLSKQDSTYFSNNVKIVELLLLHGANPTIMDNKGHTAFYYATRKNYLSDNDKKIIALLLEYGADEDDEAEPPSPSDGFAPECV